MLKQRICFLVAAVCATTAIAAGVIGVGNTNAFPEAAHRGDPIKLQLWQWGDGPERRLIAVVNDGTKIHFQSFSTNVMSIRFRVQGDHDTIFCRVQSSDQVPSIGWGPDKVVPYEGDITERVYRFTPEIHANFPAVGSYCAEVKAYKDDKLVAERTATFSIVDGRHAPANTTVLVGKKDCYGNHITSSRPVNLNRLNETPKLKDNDYPFEPQHAYNVINYERFPPFQMPPRFLQVWCSRRFSEEDRIGGPLNRGFNAVANIDPAQDNLPMDQRCMWHTPDLQVFLINKWYDEDPVAYADLKGYADYRSAFVSPSNAFKLGQACYQAWGAAGWGPYDPGVYSWDEEQMWPTIGEKLLKEHPELVPPELLSLKEKDPELKGGDTLAIIHDVYTKWWGDFVGNIYCGARSAAAEHGRIIKVWHYGSKSPGSELFHWGGWEDDPATGKPKHEGINNLHPWFRRGNQIDFEATEYSRQIDYFHKDFYYHTIFPDKASMYEKNKDGSYALDDKGRRRLRKDIIEEKTYAYPVKIGNEDYEVTPMFLKRFIAMAEDSLFWFNGGKYYKEHGTLITKKQLIPTLRPGNQETWGETARLGQRPVSPFMAEASAIFTYMTGLEGMYLWDAANNTGPEGGTQAPASQTPPDNERPYITKGDLEFIIKGMHRVSQFSKLFEGNYSFIRPTRLFDTWNRDNATLIRGFVNGRYLVLAMTNPYLDPGETQEVEVWYGAACPNRGQVVWHDKVTIQARKNHIFQCKLPALPKGQAYDPDKLYFHYTLVDGKYTKEFTVTGNYTVVYPNETGHGVANYFN